MSNQNGSWVCTSACHPKTKYEEIRQAVSEELRSQDSDDRRTEWQTVKNIIPYVTSLCGYNNYKNIGQEIQKHGNIGMSEINQFMQSCYLDSLVKFYILDFSFFHLRGFRPLSLISHPGANEFAWEGDNLSSRLITSSPINQRSISL